MNDLGDYQIKRRERDSENITTAGVYLILDSHPNMEFEIKQESLESLFDAPVCECSRPSH